MITLMLSCEPSFFAFFSNSVAYPLSRRLPWQHRSRLLSLSNWRRTKFTHACGGMTSNRPSLAVMINSSYTSLAPFTSTSRMRCSLQISGTDVIKSPYSLPSIPFPTLKCAFQ